MMWFQVPQCKYLTPSCCKEVKFWECLGLTVYRVYIMPNDAVYISTGKQAPLFAGSQILYSVSDRMSHWKQRLYLANLNSWCLYSTNKRLCNQCLFHKDKFKQRLKAFLLSALISLQLKAACDYSGGTDTMGKRTGSGSPQKFSKKAYVYPFFSYVVLLPDLEPVPCIIFFSWNSPQLLQLSQQ